VKILLDCSPAKIMEYRERYGVDFWQLRTPLTGYRRCPDVPYALDNGCFARFERDAWMRLVEESYDDPPLFLTLPDIVGDAARTVELFHAFRHKVNGVRLALVLQDGIENVEIPWNLLHCVFVGGSDDFKYSKEALAAARAAKMLDKWVHVGRVNTAKRVRNWIGLADSIDGSGISRFDHMLEDVLKAIADEHPQQAMAV
jgi:hypothetical protein